ncbi:MAG: cytochrome b, partial [Ostreibacterium sp.]
MKDSYKRLSHLTISLHWLVGLTIIGLIAVGLYMSENEVYALYPIHKSLGMIIFVFILLRILWRIKNGWIEDIGDKPWENKLARIIHWVLIIGTLLFPISGIVMSGAGGKGLSIFSWELF